MSEVDRLSNSGLYPALPIADKRKGEHPNGGASAKQTADKEKRPPDKEPAPGTPRPPKSLIDEYA
jgi:hypothetical protein